MKIYGDLGSGNCLKVKYTADRLGLSYTWIPVDTMKGETKTPEFLAALRADLLHHPVRKQRSAPPRLGAQSFEMLFDLELQPRARRGASHPREETLRRSGIFLAGKRAPAQAAGDEHTRRFPRDGHWELGQCEWPIR